VIWRRDIVLLNPVDPLQFVKDLHKSIQDLGQKRIAKSGGLLIVIPDGIIQLGLGDL
jgi:hypothetical protein